MHTYTALYDNRQDAEAAQQQLKGLGIIEADGLEHRRQEHDRLLRRPVQQHRRLLGRAEGRRRAGRPSRL
jgi:hypothetical protein